MNNKEIARITKELEDLLMTEEKTELAEEMEAAAASEDVLWEAAEPREEKRRLGFCNALVVSFLVPVVIMVVIFVQRGIFPFG